MQSGVTDAALQADSSGAAALSLVTGLIAYLVMGIVYAVVVFMVARKRGKNPWPWTIATLVPVFGLLVGALYMLLSFLSALDRLNTLEQRTTFS